MRHTFPISLFLACITTDATAEEISKLVRYIESVGGRSKLNSIQIITTDGMKSYQLYHDLRYNYFESHINVVISTGGFVQIPNVGPNIEILAQKMEIMTRLMFKNHGILIVSDFPMNQILGGFLQYTLFEADIADLVKESSEEKIRLEFLMRGKNCNLVIYDVNLQAFI